MDLAAHAFAQRGVDHAVAGERQLAGEGFTDDGGLEVHAVGTLDVDPGTGKAGFDEPAHGICIHVGGEEQRRLLP